MSRDNHSELSSLITLLIERKVSDGSLYSTLAPVYEFMFACNPASKQHFIDQSSLAKATLPADTRSILEVGCGTGRLIPNLEQEYETVVAVDVHKEMVSLSRERATYATVLQADARDTTFDRSFDVIVLFEFVVSLMQTKADFRALLSNCYAHLNPGGMIFCEAVDEPKVVIPESPQVFEDDVFRVERTVTKGNWLADKVFLQNERYMISEKETGRIASTIEKTPIRLIRPPELRSELKRAGFVNVELSDPLDGIVATARRSKHRRLRTPLEAH